MDKDTTLAQQVDTLKTNSHHLMLEGFKVESILQMMNYCSDTCQLQYKETGIRVSNPEVECYKNCLSKSYKLSKLGLE